MTDAQKAEVLQLRSQNVPFTQIADQIGISKNTIKSFYKRHTQCAADDSNRCFSCGNPLVQVPHTKPKRFCSDRCRYEYHNQNRTGRTIRCAYCGTDFDTRGNSTRKYCSTRCYHMSRWGS